MNSKNHCKKWLWLCLAAVGVLLFSASTLSADEKDGPYLIGPEDVLEISVWKDPDLTKQVVVRPDGKVSFPLIGEVDAGGRSVASLEKEVKKRISEYVPDAVVTVMVVQINSIKIYVVGGVAKSGEYRIGRKINVMQALAMAGGLTPFADEKDIVILRHDNKGGIKIPFNYGKVKKGKAIEQNIWLKDGDIIVVR
ncbi:MAG: polysaccharide biosynthesis/export family protein [Thermodesulfobacteriota bacterium]|nr:polysaccharide biosynthesis/export family protein [Thermodesulfobacteriota bacterium]